MQFLTILGIIFITLKLCNVIFWSWWLVLLPIYAIPAFGLTMVAMAWISWHVFNRR